MSTKIIHISDTHLGYSDLDRVNSDGVNIRENDFYLSFQKVVDEALELKPAAVIHSGDFFHRPSPANRPMVEGLTQVKRLSDAGIPFVVIAGNHSTPRTVYTSPILRAFTSIDNVYPVFRQAYEKIVIGDMVFHGIPHINDDEAFSSELAGLSPEAGKINVLMLHTSIGKDFIMEEYGEKIFPPERIDLINEFNYTAMGHWHNYHRVKKLKNTWYSGSTERLSDRETGTEKGYLAVDFSGNEAPAVSFHTMPVRTWLRCDVKKCGDKTVDEIMTEVIEFSRGNDSGDAIVSIYLHNLKQAQSISITNSCIHEQFPEALSVQPRRIFGEFRHNIMENEIQGLSLGLYFDEFIRDNSENEKEYRELSHIARKYFQLQDTEQ